MIQYPGHAGLEGGGGSWVTGDGSVVQVEEEGAVVVVGRGDVAEVFVFVHRVGCVQQLNECCGWYLLAEWGGFVLVSSAREPDVAALADEYRGAAVKPVVCFGEGSWVKFYI